MKKTDGFRFLCCAFVTSVLLLAACDNELETENIAPFFNLKFINKTLIDSLEPIIEDLDTQIDTIDSRLSNLDSLINAGDMRDFTDSIAGLTESRTTLSASLSEAQASFDDAEDGLVLINSVATFEGDEARVFEDSMSDYTLPLNAAANSSLYRISLGGIIYTLETEYTRNTVVRERTVFVEALDFHVIEEGTSFLSSSLACGDSINCTSDEATVTLFF